MTSRILVTDGDERAALAVVRSLGSAGHELFVSSRNGKSLAGASRYCTDAFAVADPLTEPESYVEEISRIIEQCSIDTLIPISEPSLLALLPERARWPQVLLPFADIQTFRGVCDKQRVLKAAAAARISVPAQVALESKEDTKQIDALQLQFPIVIKPARSVCESREGERVKLSVQHAENRAELKARIRELPDSAYPLLLQQRVIGDGMGVFLLMKEGGVLASFGHRRIREKPPAGGVSVLRESVVPEAGLLERAADLLRQFGWSGVAMVEFKVDAATGEPFLMEVNGRFWGSLQLAIDAGVDFPRLLLQAAAGGAATPSPYKAGVRSRWEWGEVDHLLSRLRRSAAELALPPGSPGRLRTLFDVCSVRRGDRSEVMRLSDPRPFAHETIAWFRGILS